MADGLAVLCWIKVWSGQALLQRLCHPGATDPRQQQCTSPKAETLKPLWRCRGVSALTTRLGWCKEKVPRLPSSAWAAGQQLGCWGPLGLGFWAV